MQESKLRNITEACKIRIDKDGKWYYQGSEIVNPLVQDIFSNALGVDGEGKYRIILENELCYVEVEDTPFIVKTIRGELETGLSILLNTNKMCKLDPENLCFGDGNVMYCILPDGMKARFSHAAYHMLGLMMEEDSEGNIILKMEDRAYQISPRQL
jgi:uncharacterized protein